MEPVGIIEPKSTLDLVSALLEIDPGLLGCYPLDKKKRDFPNGFKMKLEPFFILRTCHLSIPYALKV